MSEKMKRLDRIAVLKERERELDDLIFQKEIELMQVREEMKKLKRIQRLDDKIVKLGGYEG